MTYHVVLDLVLFYFLNCKVDRKKVLFLLNDYVEIFLLVFEL